MKKQPVVKSMEYKLPLPLSKKELIYRPYTVADEKILMAAAASKDDNVDFYVRNTMNVLKGTVINDIDVENLPSAEVELYHMALKGKSSGEEIQFSFFDTTANDKREVTVNTDQFYITSVDENLFNIPINDEVHLKMKHLTFSKRIEYASKFKQNPTDSVFETIVDCVDVIYNPKDDKEFWKVGEDITIDEVREFIFGLSGHSGKLYSFIKGLPKLAVKATLSDGSIKELDSTEIDFLS